tara:strand:- start:411 stop:1613 length:1203 start_codon:yes stop_codon:yes gene_type:complete
MALNPIANMNQGVALAGNTQQQQQQNQINQLQQGLGQQIQQGGFNPESSLDFQQLALLDPARSQVAMNTFSGLDDKRKKAYFSDMRSAREMIETGDDNGFLNLLSNRLEQVERLKGDTQGTKMIIDKFTSGDKQGVHSGLMQAERAGIELGFLSDTNKSGPVSVQSSKILDDGTIISVLKGGQRQVTSPTGEILTGEAAKNSVATSRDQAFKRKIELKKLDQTIKRTEQKENLLNDQQKAIQRGNIQRLGSLSNTSTGRSSAIKKATKFKMALESGGAFSGAARKAASFVPGVFTSQGQFDEEFNAFSEVAARQQLKASGETRPTDADVQGMKQAMFGVGRDEAVNVQLLDDFIKDQLAQDSELDQLIGASKGGSLSNFTFTPTTGAVNVGELSDEDLFN